MTQMALEREERILPKKTSIKETPSGTQTSTRKNMQPNIGRTEDELKHTLICKDVRTPRP